MVASWLIDEEKECYLCPTNTLDTRTILTSYDFNHKTSTTRISIKKETEICKTVEWLQSFSCLNIIYLPPNTKIIYCFYKGNIYTYTDIVKLSHHLVEI